MTEPAYPREGLSVFASATHWKSYLCALLLAHLRGDVLEVGAGMGSTLRGKVRTTKGMLRDLVPTASFDTILYFDMLEHVEHDGAELAAALTHLRPGGRLVVVAPAQQWLYSDLDEAIGHYRRYSARRLQAAVPQGMQRECLRYLDSVGMLASLANRLFLKQARPTRKQLLFWDRVLTRLSRLLDPLIAHSVGKNILGVWSKPAA